jgi:hypothetical protein
VHLRRALLLFAIVLGLAAVAASVSRPRDQSQAPPTVSTSESTSPTVEASPPPQTPAAITFDADHPKAHRIDSHQAATVYVKVSEPGQVSIDALGMTDAAEPTTPAEFDVFTPTPGRYPILFQPAGSDEAIEAGTLVVE